MIFSGNKLLYAFFVFSGVTHALIFLGNGVETGTKQNQPYQRPLVIQLATRSDKQGIRSQNPDRQTQQQRNKNSKRSIASIPQKQTDPAQIARRNPSARYVHRKVSNREKAPARKKNRHRKGDRTSSSSTAMQQQNSRPPRYGLGSLHNPSPDYPYRAIKHGMEGSVLVRAFVKRDGHVHSTRIERSSGYPLLDQAASRTIARWKFFPALKKGIPVAGEITVPIRFMLRKEHHQDN